MSLYNAPFGSEDHPYCAWRGNSGVSDSSLQSECNNCHQMVDDDDLEVFEIEVDGKVKRFIFCSECIEDIKAMHDSVEEYLKSIYMKKGDKVNTTIAEGTFKFQGYDSRGRAILKQKGLPPVIVPASTVHPEGVIRFENNQGSKRVVFV